MHFTCTLYLHWFYIDFQANYILLFSVVLFFAAKLHIFATKTRLQKSLKKTKKNLKDPGAIVMWKFALNLQTVGNVATHITTEDTFGWETTKTK